MSIRPALMVQERGGGREYCFGLDFEGRGRMSEDVSVGGLWVVIMRCVKDNICHMEVST